MRAFLKFLCTLALTLFVAFGAAADHRVVIKVPAPEGATAAERSATMRINQRAAVRVLFGTAYTVHRVYDRLPYVACTVSDDGLARLKESSAVVDISPDHEFKTMLKDSVPVVGADKAHAAGFTGKGRAVAILDTGTDTSHPAFAGRIVAEACFNRSQCPNGRSTMIGPGAGVPCTGSSSCFHGTHVTGIAAGSGGITGVAPDVGIVPVQVFTVSSAGNASASFSDIIAAIEWVASVGADLKIDAINMSLGTSAKLGKCDSQYQAIKDAADLALSAGIGVIAASGNGSSKTGVSSPGCISNVVAVGCTNDLDGICSFSNRGPEMEIWAPGQGIVSATVGGGTRTASGTSMSTPHVAASYALVRQNDPSIGPDLIRALLRASGKQITVPPREPSGIPRLQVDAALIGPSPRCGDGVRQDPEECDGNDDAACPGRCQADCTCRSDECPPCPDCPPSCDDADADGEVDATDRCPGTPGSVVVDELGCGQAQFCDLTKPSTSRKARWCWTGDWRDNERLKWRTRDCKVHRGTSRFDRADDRCVIYRLDDK